MVPVMALCAFNIGQYAVAGQNPRLALAMTAMLILLSGGFGFIDGRAGDPIARKQTLQFVLVSIATAGTFTLKYLCAYAAGHRKLRTDDPNSR